MLCLRLQPKLQGCLPGKWLLERVNHHGIQVLSDDRPVCFLILNCAVFELPASQLPVRSKIPFQGGWSDRIDPGKGSKLLFAPRVRGNEQEQGFSKKTEGADLSAKVVHFLGLR